MVSLKGSRTSTGPFELHKDGASTRHEHKPVRPTTSTLDGEFDGEQAQLCATSDEGSFN